MKVKIRDKEMFFSIELESKTSLKSLSLTNDDNNNALVEGTLGNLVNASFIEDEILEIIGEKGIFRINLMRIELIHSKGSGLRDQVVVQETKEVK